MSKALLDYNLDTLPTRYNNAPDGEWLSRLLANKSITEKLCFYQQSYYGTADYKQLTDAALELGGFRVYYLPDAGREPSSNYVTDDTVFQINRSDKDDDSCSVTIQSTNDEAFEAYCAKFKALISKSKPAGKVFVLIPSPGGIEVESIGLAGVPFLEDNYSPEVVDGYNRIVADIKSKNPLGRLAVLDGPPGSGKTFTIRSLMHDCPSAMFVLIPSNMIADLGGPSLISALINIKQKDRTICLVLEDSDTCLTSRGSDNISAISSVLNISDGIIGNMIDIRIICTTNIDTSDIDAAVLRPGRLSALVHIDLLPAEQAARIHKRLTGEDKEFKEGKFFSLAEIYSMAKKGLDPDFATQSDYSSSVKSGKTSKRRVGFTINRPPKAPDRD